MTSQICRVPLLFSDPKRLKENLINYSDQPATIHRRIIVYKDPNFLIGSLKIVNLSVLAAAWKKIRKKSYFPLFHLIPQSFKVPFKTSCLMSQLRGTAYPLLTIIHNPKPTTK